MSYILQKRILNEEVLKLLSVLRYKNKPIELVGSASLQSQRYFSDYDFFSVIGKVQLKSSFDEFNKILERIKKNPNYYLIELKIQLKNGEKTKINPPIFLEFDEYARLFPHIDFVKIDLCIFSEFRFIEVSIIYKIFEDKLFTKEVYVKELQNSIKELNQDKSYYKVLKRMFNINKVQGNKDNLVKLANFFNSDVGELYQIKSNLEAIKLMKKFYPNDEMVKQKIKVNLAKIKPYKLANLDKILDEINTKALDFKKIFR